MARGAMAMLRLLRVWRERGARAVSRWGAAEGEEEVSSVAENGGGGGIRTHGTVSRTPVFKTGALNHSATPPRRASFSRLPGRAASAIACAATYRRQPGRPGLAAQGRAPLPLRPSAVIRAGRMCNLLFSSRGIKLQTDWTDRWGLAR